MSGDDEASDLRKRLQEALEHVLSAENTIKGQRAALNAKQAELEQRIEELNQMAVANVEVGQMNLQLQADRRAMLEVVRAVRDELLSPPLAEEPLASLRRWAEALTRISDD
jgi:hypothetical protein